MIAKDTDGIDERARSIRQSLVWLGGIGLCSMLLGPAFALIFQREPAPGIVGAALLSVGTCYLFLRRAGHNGRIAVGAGLGVATVVVLLLILLRPIWTPWIA